MSLNNPIYNFNAGPAMLPVEVMRIAEQEFRNYQDSGMSIMEMSHRGKHFGEVLERAESNLRKLLSLHHDYEIGFFPGGATLQFSAIPMNLLAKKEQADYSLTGVWAVKAAKEAKALGFEARTIYDGQKNGFLEVPELSEKDIDPQSKYLYITSNNTIYGTRYAQFPKIRSVPLIADMTSDILSREINASDFGIIFAGAQKNIGPSGLTLVIARKDLLEWKKEPVPILLDYKVYLTNKSLYNTPPTYSIYIAGLVFDWCIQQGGLSAIEKQNEAKAKLLYDFLDQSQLFTAPVKGKNRSTMNVVFHLKDKSLEKKFVEESEKEGLIGLAGHRDAGGMRASIYNAMPIEGVRALIQFMKDFENRRG
jgi:phosphoserine aminotransferase